MMPQPEVHSFCSFHGCVRVECLAVRGIGLHALRGFAIVISEVSCNLYFCIFWGFHMDSLHIERCCWLWGAQKLSQRHCCPWGLHCCIPPSPQRLTVTPEEFVNFVELYFLWMNQRGALDKEVHYNLCICIEIQFTHYKWLFITWIVKFALIH